jgi:hypothetical protein
VPGKKAREPTCNRLLTGIFHASKGNQIICKPDAHSAFFELPPGWSTKGLPFCPKHGAAIRIATKYFWHYSVPTGALANPTWRALSLQKPVSASRTISVSALCSAISNTKQLQGGKTNQEKETALSCLSCESQIPLHHPLANDFLQPPSESTAQEQCKNPMLSVFAVTNVDETPKSVPNFRSEA